MKLNLFGTPDLESFNHGNSRYYILPDSDIAVPSVTSVIYRDVVFADTPYMKQARDRGTLIHNLCENYLLNEGKLIDAGNIMPVNMVAFKKIQEEIDANLSEVNLIEGCLSSTYLWTAGRVDCVGAWDDHLSIIDFKTAKNAKQLKYVQNYFVQAACYARMFTETFPSFPIENLVIVVAPDHHETAQVFREPFAKYKDMVEETFRHKRKLWT